MRKSIFLIFIFSIFILTCQKKESTASGGEAVTLQDADTNARSAAAPPVEPSQPLRGADAAPEDRRAARTFFTTSDVKGRLLEYKVDLSYTYEDFQKSRHLLQKIASKYGFLISANSSFSESVPSMSAEMRVRSESLYDVLQEMDGLGELNSESISVTDHTESFVAQNRKIAREQLRGVRRSQAMNQAARDYSQREEALSRGEDEQDNAEQAKWAIEDRVAYATISVHISPRSMPEKIEVPSYRDALVGALNVFLRFLYVLLYILPLLVVVGLAAWGFIRFIKWIQKKLSSVK